MSNNTTSLLSLAKYKDIYRMFSKIRSIEQEISKKYIEGKMRCQCIYLLDRKLFHQSYLYL